jgi:RimJ/RimL family protein N-acetyltransferase
MTQDLNDRVELKTDRLLLRPFDFRDVDDVLAYASEPGFGQYLPIPQPYTRDDAVEFVARQVLAEWSTRPAFAMVLDGHVVGGLSLRVDGRHERAELGYALAKKHWGKGLTLEAARAVVGWGFARYSLYKVYARADLRNCQSWRVMEKFGMIREGVLRSHDKPRDERVDDAYYGILRDEWASAG